MTEQQLAELMHADLGDGIPANIELDELTAIVRVDILADAMADAPTYRPLSWTHRSPSGPVETGVGR